MKPVKPFIAFFFVIIMTSTVSAKTVYVNDLIKLMLRSGRGLDNRIIAIIESGDAVEMLEAGDQWSRVRTQSGHEGWVLSRYLTEEETASRKLARLQAAQETMVEENERLKEENHALKSENQTLSETLSNTNEEFSGLKKAHESLREESAEFLSLKKAFSRASGQLSELQEQNQQLAATLNQLERNQNIRWFITGASVLLAGFLIGLSSRRKRRKPSLI